MTHDDIRAEFAANPALKEMIPDWEGIADVLSAPTMRSIPVETLFDVLFASGDYTALKTAQLEGNPLAVMAFATLADAKNLGSGMVNQSLPGTKALLDSLQSARLLTDKGRADLAAAAMQPNPVNEYDIRRALYNDDGSLAI